MKTGNLTLIVCGIILIIYRVIFKIYFNKKEKSLHRKTEINYGQAIGKNYGHENGAKWSQSSPIGYISLNSMNGSNSICIGDISLVDYGKSTQNQAE
jgi:hypothetical protein